MALSFKWTEERDNLTHLIGDSETMPQVGPEILNVVGKGELGPANLSSKFARKKIQETIKLWHVGTIFQPNSIVLVDVLKNKFEFSFTALLEIKLNWSRGGILCR